MPITLNQTILNNADATTGWATFGAAAALAAGSVPPKQGTNCVEFHYTGTGGTGGIQTPTFTAVSVRTGEIGVWFLNPKKSQAGEESELIRPISGAIRLRLFSGANSADYYQDQHRLGNGEFQGGWLYLRASGEAGSEDLVSAGTWGNAQADSVNAVGVYVDGQQGNDDKNALEYQVDYVKYYDKIVVTGLNGMNPYTLADIYAEDLADNGANPEEWGVVNNLENFFKFYSGLEIGDGTTATEFEASNEFIFLDHSSSAHKYDVTIRNNATVTLGVKNTTGVVEDYAQDGVQIVATENGLFQLTTPNKCSPAFTVESGGVLRIYAGLLQGFGTVNFGSGGTGIIETLFSDFYDNDIIEFRTTGLTVDACRYHTDSADKQDLGIFYNSPSSLNRITVFNCVDGLVFRISYNGANFVQTYRSLGGTTYDVGVLEAATVDLVDSTFDPDRIVRVT
ncbi:MAG: hypothetical protein QNJ81_02255 [Acidimicrobiia bacterium]|nr:hypothetical protein [Acidimicrobiia bacterium]